jgi:hypothetical protein
MNSPQNILSDYIIGLNNIEDVNKHLFQNYNIMTKDFPELNMTIYYNKYDNKHKNQIELASRSVILTRDTHEVICYTCPTPIYNMDAVQYLWRNQDKSRNTFVCYEGSLISFFYFNGKWFVSSRKNIYGHDKDVDNIGGQYKMLLDVLKNDNYNSIDEFTNKLDNKNSYHFVLIHHDNENIVNYKNQFGDEYKKLCFIFARDSISKEELKYEALSESSFLSNNIFLPQSISDNETEGFIAKISNMSIINQPEYEGIVIKINNNLLKLQSPAYQFHKAIGSEKNMFRGFISLYQNNSLKNFFTSETEKFKKIVNPMNTKESFDTIGMIDALFKVITSELFNLFNILWDNNGHHLNKNLYNKLPREYKDILFHLRGFQFTNINKNNVLKMKDVYNYIKSVDPSLFEKFLRCRKLMLNWTRLESNDENVKTFSDSLHKCEKVYYKLAAIYTTKLFPEIMPDDIPTFN